MINDYTGLKASISRWLHRSDLVNVVPDLIMLAEVRFNRNLRVRQMEKSETLVLTDGAASLPADWIEFVGSPMDGDRPLQFVPRDKWQNYRQYGCYYTIMGSQIYVSDGPTSITADYYAKMPSLSDQAATNWLLADGPDAYLYGALLESAPYIKDDPRVETWRGLLQVALTDLQAASDRAKYSGGSLVVM
ncbi:MAG: hypothetical protein WBF88_17510 [Pusillimonas sp.]